MFFLNAGRTPTIAPTSKAGERKHACLLTAPPFKNVLKQKRIEEKQILFKSSTVTECEDNICNDDDESHYNSEKNFEI